MVSHPLFKEAMKAIKNESQLLNSQLAFMNSMLMMKAKCDVSRHRHKVGRGLNQTTRQS